MSFDLETPKPYIITYENNQMIVSMMTYEMFSFNKKMIEESLSSIKFKGFVIIDSLTSLGTSHNRFIKLYFNGFIFDRSIEAELIAPKYQFLKERNDFYREKKSIWKNSHILSEKAISDFFNGDNFRELHCLPYFKQILKDLNIKEFCFEGDFIVYRYLVGDNMDYSNLNVLYEDIQISKETELAELLLDILSDIGVDIFSSELPSKIYTEDNSFNAEYSPYFWNKYIFNKLKEEIDKYFKQ